MATQKQIEANRRNAQKSSGPKTPGGKERTRLNALTHGLTAETAVLPGENAEAFLERVEVWKEELGPRSALESYLVERAARISWQADRADRTQVARLAETIRHNRAEEAIHEAEDVAVLGRRLFWDPRGPIAVYPHFEYQPKQPRISWPESVDDPNLPAPIVCRLEASATGCQWLLGRWADLRRILEEGMSWQAPDRLRAVRLLGKQPLDAVDDDQVMSVYVGCAAMDASEGWEPLRDLCHELSAGEIKIYNQRLLGRQESPRTPEDAEGGKALLLRIVATAMARLETLLTEHADRKPTRPAELVDALAFDDSESGERLRRYQLGCGRSLMRTLSTLIKVRESLGQSPPCRAKADVSDSSPPPAESVTSWSQPPEAPPARSVDPMPAPLGEPVELLLPESPASPAVESVVPESLAVAVVEPTDSSALHPANDESLPIGSSDETNPISPGRAEGIDRPEPSDDTPEGAAEIRMISARKPVASACPALEPTVRQPHAALPPLLLHVLKNLVTGQDAGIQPPPRAGGVTRPAMPGLAPTGDGRLAKVEDPRMARRPRRRSSRRAVGGTTVPSGAP